MPAAARAAAPRVGPLLAAAAAALAYLNALPADFAFDDHFALTYNGDVTDANKPLSALWRNDFWGQDIRGEGSHKSYRRVPGAAPHARAAAACAACGGPPRGRLRAALAAAWRAHMHSRSAEQAAQPRAALRSSFD
jgi:hypothetical protein